MAVENPIRIKVSLRELHALRAGVAWFDEGLQLRLYERIKDKEGRLTEDELYASADEILKMFRNGVHLVRGYNEATAQAYLTEHPDQIRIFNERRDHWWDVSYGISTESYPDTNDQSHDEGLSIKDRFGLGLDVGRSWWTGKNHQRHGDITFTSDPRVVREGQHSVGHHWQTRLAVDSSKDFLSKFLANQTTI